MRAALFAVVLVALFAASSVFGQSTASKADQNLIEQAIGNWDKAWQTKDHKLAAKDYSDDAEWTNAFGMKRKGRVEIEKTLAEVFALPFVMAGESKTVEQTVRFIKPDVAYVITRVERVGQEAPSGTALGNRQTSHLRIFARSGRQWKIISHLISDARDTQQPKH